MTTNSKKTGLTEEEWALVETIFNKHAEMQTQQVDDQDIINIVNEMWAATGLAKPQIIILDSPSECKKACPNPNEFTEYSSDSLYPYAATFEFAKETGLELDKENYRRFMEWCRCCPFILFNNTTVYVSRKDKNRRVECFSR